MDVPTYFEDFLKEIRPPETQRGRMSAAHLELRERLSRDKKLAPILISNFVQGSYRRHTGLVGTKTHEADVDLVVVTNVSSLSPPTVALELFRPFLEENYKGRYTPQGRSWCISWSDDITLDLVPTSAPSEVDLGFFRSLSNGFTFDDPIFDRSKRLLENRDPLLHAYLSEQKKGWKSEPLEIPDREAKIWEKTHPLAQIAWTAEKNSRCDGHYINVVRAIKWWRRMLQPLPKYPKGYPLEHIVGVSCRDNIGSIAEGVALSLEKIVQDYRYLAQAGQKPYLKDHGVEQDVFKRVPAEDFVGFYNNVVKAADLAQRARAAETVTASVTLWRELFGTAFPEPPKERERVETDIKVGGFSDRGAPTIPAGGRFA